MVTNIISDYIPPFSPLPNIAPFTYKDGETYLSTLDNIRTYVNVTLVDFINTNFQLLGDSTTTEINALIAEVNAALAGVGNNITEIQTIHDQVVALVASLPDLTNTLNSINNGVASATASATAAATSETNSATNATSAANSATDATVAASSAASAAAGVINAQKGQNYGIAGLDGTGIVLETNIPSRLSDVNLKTEFADKSIESIVTSGRLSDTSLNAEFIPIIGNSTIKSFNTYLLLIASSGNVGDIAVAKNIPSVYFQHDGISWKMQGIANFADITAFNNAITSSVSRMKRRLATNYYDEQYLIYPSDGVSVSGWYPVDGVLPFTKLGMTAAQNLTNSGVNAPVNWDKTISNMFGMFNSANSLTKINILIAGRYMINGRIVNGAPASGTQYISANFAKNGSPIQESYGTYPSANTSPAFYSASTIINLASGDYIEFNASGPSSGSYPLVSLNSSFIVQYLNAA